MGIEGFGDDFEVCGTLVIMVCMGGFFHPSRFSGCFSCKVRDSLLGFSIEWVYTWLMYGL